MQSTKGVAATGFDRSRLAATPEGQTALPGLIQGSPVMVFRQKSAFARKASEGCRAEAHLGERGRGRERLGMPRSDHHGERQPEGRLAMAE